ncbi:MAG TPA: NAD(P)H-dependent glycerol-3-phosphate dehydrogenase [Elusimicrobiota bacterium]|jgi:glycerol-3-phosphate dehydrogenase (NAD(P)+)|nr:NAD(P)H-dependent glycerol-3-phosphate dehydrogenase [Elusimicrobiota bacterium]
MSSRRKEAGVTVLGGGLWGTALANHLARTGTPVRLWEFFPELARKLQETRRHPHIPGLTLRPLVRVGSDLEAAVDGATTLLVVLPSSSVRSTARRLRPMLEKARPRPVLINASKGVEPESLRTMGEVLEEELPFLGGRIFTLSGPSFAREVARGVPTKLVLAGTGATPEALRRLDRGSLRVQRSPDRIGVELGGSLKNVLAVGCGILDGLNAGANTKAALMTEGIAEMGALIEKLGGRRETIYGLSGLGDLIATGTSSESRNRLLGEKLGAGKGLKRALKEIPTVAEGAESARSAYALARSCGLKAPIIGAIWRVAHKGARPEAIVEALGFTGGRARPGTA